MHLRQINTAARVSQGVVDAFPPVDQASCQMRNCPLTSLQAHLTARSFVGILYVAPPPARLRSRWGGQRIRVWKFLRPGPHRRLGPRTRDQGRPMNCSACH